MLLDHLRAPPLLAEQAATLFAINQCVQLAEQQARRQFELRAAARQSAFDAHIEVALVAHGAAASAASKGSGAASGFGESAPVAKAHLAAAEAALHRKT